MNRKYDRETYYKKCCLIRRYFPDAAITTDVIVGYSTETESDFLDSLELCQRVEFADIHCFPYSRREGTVGAKLKELPSSVKDGRMDRILAVKSKLKENFVQKNLGKVLTVIPEEVVDGYTVGYTENYLRVYLKGEIKEKILRVEILSPYQDGALAKVYH